MGKPEVHYDPSGPSGNVFCVIGAATRALVTRGMRACADEMLEKLRHAKTYDDVLSVIAKYVRLRKRKDA